MPKEHGSWGMFFLPLALGLIAAGQMPPATALFIVAALLVFLAREPFLEAWRLWRRGRPLSSRGWRGVAMLLAAAVLGGILLPRYPFLLAFGGVAGAVLIWQAQAAMRGTARKLHGELIAVCASMLNAPAAFYVASGKLDELAAALFGLALIYFAGTVFYVKMRVRTAHARSGEDAGPARRSCLMYHAFMAALLLGLVAARILPWVGALGYTPAIARGLFRALRPTRELNLRLIGWSEVTYSLLWLGGLALAFHTGKSMP